MRDAVNSRKPNPSSLTELYPVQIQSRPTRRRKVRPDVASVRSISTSVGNVFKALFAVSLDSLSWLGNVQAHEPIFAAQVESSVGQDW